MHGGSIFVGPLTLARINMNLNDSIDYKISKENI